LEIPLDFKYVVCAACGAAYDLREHKGAIDLLERNSEPRDPVTIIDSRLAELEELIGEAHLEIEAIRSRQKSAPLQLGCAFFGLFTMVMLVVVLFMLLGRGYFGHWLFYVSIAAVVMLGLTRIRRKLAGSPQTEELRRERIQLEEGLAELESERERILRLKASL